MSDEQMSDEQHTARPGWSFRINSQVAHSPSLTGQTAQVAAMFGLGEEHSEKLFDDFPLQIQPGQIVAVLGPSGAGKSVLLRQVQGQTRDAISLDNLSPAQAKRPAAELLTGSDIKDKLATLARCGLAEATTLITPAGLLSGGQRYRLALARAMQKAKTATGPKLILADEFCSTLDVTTAAVLCRQMRKVISQSNLALLVAMPRTELLDALKPDATVVKPMGSPAYMLPREQTRRGKSHKSKRHHPLPNPRKWPIVPGRLTDYRKLEQYHYITGPPACHKRVYIIRTPARLKRTGGAEIAAVLVVSPPVISARGRNVATFRRYVSCDRRAALAKLNAEVETISRVIVHPTFRGCGLAVKLVKHAIKTSPMPIIEALAAMGKIHPFFSRAGMKCAGVFKGPSQYYHYYITKKN